MRKGRLAKYGGELWAIKDAVEVFKENYGIKFGSRQIYEILRRLKILNSNNTPQIEYEDKGYFEYDIDLEALRHSYYGHDIFRRVYLTKEGMDFVAWLLQANKDISLKREEMNWVGDRIE